jgi:hypothetical protein
VMLYRVVGGTDMRVDQGFGADDGTRTRDPHLGKETVGGSFDGRFALWYKAC